MNELTNKWGPYRQAKLETNFSRSIYTYILINCFQLCWYVFCFKQKCIPIHYSKIVFFQKFHNQLLSETLLKQERKNSVCTKGSRKHKNRYGYPLHAASYRSWKNYFGGRYQQPPGRKRP